MRKRVRLVLLVALVLVSLATATFAVRVYHHSHRIAEHRDQQIQGWMNIPFISHSYHVPPELIHDALGLPREQRDRRPLRAIAAEQGRPLEELILAIAEAIQAARAPAPPLPPQPPGPPGPPEPPGPPAPPDREGPAPAP
jgi:hypothetical protein